MAESVFRPGRGRATREKTLEAARDRAVEYIGERCNAARTSADGRLLGIQATVARDAEGQSAISLEEFADGMLFDPTHHDAVFRDDPLRDTWREIIDQVRRKLGFPLEPELFTNMLLATHLCVDGDRTTRQLAAGLVSVFKDTELDGLFHFFSSPRFAADIDCTGVAARALWLSGHQGALSRINQRILGSAATTSLSAKENQVMGKNNGPLVCNVFKVYLDDHRSQPASLDRGLKHDPAVVCNALYPVLLELRSGVRSVNEVVRLREFFAAQRTPWQSEASVGDIVAANIWFITRHLASDGWRQGTRYYPNPETFLFFFGELVASFPTVMNLVASERLLADAVQECRAETTSDPLRLALRALAARHAGLDPDIELDALVEHQQPDGSWPGFSSLYAFGSKAPRVYFGSSVLTAALAARALGREPSEPVPWDRSLTWLESRLEAHIQA